MRLSTKWISPAFGRTELYFPLLAETFSKFQEFWEFIYCSMDWNHSSTNRFWQQYCLKHPLSGDLFVSSPLHWHKCLGYCMVELTGEMIYLGGGWEVWLFFTWIIPPLIAAGCTWSVPAYAGKGGSGRSRKMRAAQTAVLLNEKMQPTYEFQLLLCL